MVDMDPMDRAVHWRWFLAHFLFVLVAWTLFIKYLFPIAVALSSGTPWHSHVYWDLWPLAHLWLGWALLRQPGYLRILAIAMAAIEIVIIVTKFALFLAEPQWDIWRTNWFVNKVFVLSYFVLVLATAVARPRALSAQPRDSREYADGAYK